MGAFCVSAYSFVCGVSIRWLCEALLVIITVVCSVKTNNCFRPHMFPGVDVCEQTRKKLVMDRLEIYLKDIQLSFCMLPKVPSHQKR